MALLLFPSIASIWAETPLNHFNLLLNHTAFSILLSNCENDLLSHIEIHDFRNGNPTSSAHFEANFETGIMYSLPFKMTLYFKWETVHALHLQAPLEMGSDTFPYCIIHNKINTTHIQVTMDAPPPNANPKAWKKLFYKIIDNNLKPGGNLMTKKKYDNIISVLKARRA
jgi:hypothetical protein